MSKEISMKKKLDEICKNCGCTYGAHCASSYYSGLYKMFVPQDYCPGHERRMDWDEGPGTIFKSTGTYKEDKEDDLPAF